MHSLRISILLLLLIHCAPLKEDVSDLDVRRIIDRISISRFSIRLENEDLTVLKTDKEIFYEACEVYRLKPEIVLNKIKSSHPQLYAKLKDSNEK
ncbi:MAG: hypothetical protein H7A24_05425 [Leptospiraceae bacterium]|nr:hypothetical protein [Leptospiraceae bacterium]MCP5511298.1 hypothetical protein [Leptospiraceae bacterium]